MANSNKKVIKKYERNLLIHSKIIEQYPDLQQLLVKYPSVDDNMVKDCIDMKKATQELLKTTAIRTVIDKAQSEWIAERQYKEGEINCGLCNHPNKYIYFIRNIFNDEKINVGSECIKNFPLIKNKDNISIVEQIENDKKERDDFKKRVKRETKFGMCFPKYVKDIGRFEYGINKFPYIVGWDHYNQSIRAVERIKTLKDDFLKGKKTCSCFNDIEKEFKTLRRIHEVEIPKYMDDISNKKYVCTRVVQNWLYS